MLHSLEHVLFVVRMLHLLHLYDPLLVEHLDGIEAQIVLASHCHVTLVNIEQSVQGTNCIPR